MTVNVEHQTHNVEFLIRYSALLLNGRATCGASACNPFTQHKSPADAARAISLFDVQRSMLEVQKILPTGYGKNHVLSR